MTTNDINLHVANVPSAQLPAVNTNRNELPLPFIQKILTILKAPFVYLAKKIETWKFKKINEKNQIDADNLKNLQCNISHFKYALNCNDLNKLEVIYKNILNSPLSQNLSKSQLSENDKFDAYILKQLSLDNAIIFFILSKAKLFTTTHLLTYVPLLIKYNQKRNS